MLTASCDHQSYQEKEKRCHLATVEPNSSETKRRRQLLKPGLGFPCAGEQGRGRSNGERALAAVVVVMPAAHHHSVDEFLSRRRDLGGHELRSIRPPGESGSDRAQCPSPSVIRSR